MSSTGQVSSTKVLKYIEGPLVDGKLRTGWERFMSSVETQPDKLAVVSVHQPPALYPGITESIYTGAASLYLKWTYRDLKVAVDRLALQLRSRGVQPGTVIVTFLPNGVESIVARLTSSSLGCVLAPLSPKHLANKHEVAYLLSLFLQPSGAVETEKAAVVIAADEHTAARIEEEQMGFIKQCVVKILCPLVKVCGDRPEFDPILSAAGWCCFQDLMQQVPGLPPLLSMSSSSSKKWPTDELILCTSGMTSLPKACFWTTSQISYHCHVMEQSGVHGLSPEDKVLVCLSNNHIAGYDALSSALFFGATAVIPGPAFDVEQFVRAATQEKVTYTALVPTSEPIFSVRFLSAVDGQSRS